jgi:hypothetical protein
MTKREAAVHALGLAMDINRRMAGDDDGDAWVVRALWIATSLDPHIANHPKFMATLMSDDTRESKLRRLIDHPSTPPAERDAAVSALARIRA